MRPPPRLSPSLLVEDLLRLLVLGPEPWLSFSPLCDLLLLLLVLLLLCPPPPSPSSRLRVRSLRRVPMMPGFWEDCEDGACVCM